MPPVHGLAQEQTSGIKGDKTRLTYGFCSNADGSEKFEPAIIAKAKKPRCFQKKGAADLGFNFYYWNKKAWMANGIFQE
jgi:hypothetical protein